MPKMKRQAVPIPGTDMVVGGLRPRIVVWVKTGNARCRDAWHKLCKELGLFCEPVRSNDGELPPKDAWETAFDCWGPPEGLKDVSSGCHKIVLRCENAMKPAYQPYPTIGREKMPNGKSSRPSRFAPHPFAVFISKEEVLRK